MIIVKCRAIVFCPKFHNWVVESNSKCKISLSLRKILILGTQSLIFLLDAG